MTGAPLMALIHPFRASLDAERCFTAPGPPSRRPLRPGVHPGSLLWNTSRSVPAGIGHALFP